jgi:hypothetical protein
MTTLGRRHQLQLEGEREQREKWGRPLPEVMTKAIDDIRARVVEEGWYGRSLYEVSQDVEKMFKREDLYGRDDIGKGREAEQEARMQEQERNRDQELER